MFKILRNTFRGKPECETGASGVGRQLQALLFKIRIRIGIWVQIRIKIKISIWNWIWIGFNIQWLLFITKMLFGIWILLWIISFHIAKCNQQYYTWQLDWVGSPLATWPYVFWYMNTSLNNQFAHSKMKMQNMAAGLGGQLAHLLQPGHMLHIS